MFNKPDSQGRAIFSGISLALIACICVFSILSVEHETSAAITANREAKSQQLMQTLLPKVDLTDPTIKYECRLLSDRRIGSKMKAYIVTNHKDELLGIISSYATSRGYSNPLILIAGIDANGHVAKVDVELSKETPGIGDKVERKRSNFLDQFDDKNMLQTRWDVKKFGGEFDYITGATVTSRAIVLATKDLLDVVSSTDFTKLPKCPAR